MQTKIIDFKKYSTIKIGQKVEIELIDSSSWDKKGYFIVGFASNILLPDDPQKIAMLSKKLDYIKIDDNKLIIGGATKSGKIFNFCKKHNIFGFEFLAKLPGSLGGLVAMNAGVKEHEIFNHLLKATTNKGTFSKNQIDYGYRYCNLDGVIFEAVFDLKYGFDRNLVQFLNNLRANQPKEPSAGSCFKNPKGFSAGRLLDEVGLKGKRVGGMAFSDIHANFLINLGGGSYQNAITLINLAKQKVKEKSGINLELEIKIPNIKGAVS